MGLKKQSARNELLLYLIYRYYHFIGMSEIDILKIKVETVKGQYFLLQVIQFFKNPLLAVFKFLFGFCVI